MPNTTLAPCFTKLVQSFFTEYLVHQRTLSPRSIAAYRDTFRLLRKRPRVNHQRLDRPMLGFLSRDEMLAILEAPDP
jgi:hypothetical protein